MAIAESLSKLAAEDGEMPPALAKLSREATKILKEINTKPADAVNGNSQQAA